MSEKPGRRESGVSLRDEVVTLFNEGLSDTPGASFELRVERDVSAPSGGWVIRLRPTRADCASLTAHIADTGEDVEFVVGKDTLIEVDRASRWRPMRTSSFDQEVRAILSAVLEGRISEERWIRNGRVLRSKGTVRIDDTELKFSSDHGGFFAWRAERSRVNYRAYAGGQP